MQLNLKLTSLLVISLSLPASLRADTLVLRSGKRIKGRILFLSREHVRIKTPDNKIRHYKKNLVLRLLYDTASPRRAKPKKAVKPVKTRELPEIPGKGHLWRAALIPGWGLLYKKRKLQGGLYLSAFLSSLALTATRANLATRAKADYNQALSQSLLISALAQTTLNASPPVLHYLQSQGQDSSYKSAAAGFNLALGLTGLIYLSQFIHTWAFAASSRKTAARKSLNLSIIPELTPRTGESTLRTNLSFTRRF